MEEHINMAPYIAFEDLIFEMHLDGIKNQKRVKKCCCHKDIIIIIIKLSQVDTTWKCTKRNEPPISCNFFNLTQTKTCYFNIQKLTRVLKVR